MKKESAYVHFVQSILYDIIK